MRTVHNLQQGSDAWKAHRAAIFNASEAPAVMGASKYTTRSELLREKHTGLAATVDSATQARFDRGHAVEQPTVAMIEEVIGDSLAPVVASIEIDGLKLGASYDGLSMLEDTGAEVKLWNEDLAAQVRRGELEPHYYWQLEQQFLCTPTLERIIFATSDGTPERFVWMEYRPVPGRAKELLAAWTQFAIDLANYEQVADVRPAAVHAAPIEALPAVSVRMEGALTVHSNLDVFSARLRDFVAKIPAKPSTEQEFADCDAACKALKRAEEALDGAEANALGQVSSVEQITRTIADLRSVARTARLAAEKTVKARKEQIRGEEVERGRKALNAHLADLNAQIGKPYMPPIVSDFPGAISGKKTVDSVRAAVDQHLADKKIEANAIAGTIQTNMGALRELAKDHAFLFADAGVLVLKAPEDCRAMIESRIAAHNAEQQRRAAALAEQERERIRAEEAAKLQAEQRAAAPAPAPTPAPAPIARPAVFSQAAAAPAPRAASGPPTLKLGTLCERIAPLSVTAAGLEELGFPPAGRERSAVLYHEAAFPEICRALINRLEEASQPVAA